MNNQLDFLDIITLLSFYIQLENNEELHRQTTNDEIVEDVHRNLKYLIDENRKATNTIIEQNNEIIKLLKGE